MVWYVENSLLSSNTERQLLVALQAAGNGLWLPLERAESPSHSRTVSQVQSGLKHYWDEP